MEDSKKIIKLPEQVSSTRTRPHLAELVRIAKAFAPAMKGATLVTELTPFVPVNLKIDYTKDALIYHIGKAVPELMDYAKEHDKALSEITGLEQVIARMHLAAIGREGGTVGNRAPWEDVEDLHLKAKRAYDFIQNLIENVPQDRVKDTAKEFISKFPLVNETNGTNDAGTAIGSTD